MSNMRWITREEALERWPQPETMAQLKARQKLINDAHHKVIDLDPSEFKYVAPDGDCA